MTRLTAAVDRLVVAVSGLGLMGLGALSVAWQAGRVEGVPTRISLPRLVDATGEQWWPWACGIAAVALAALALAWAFPHRPARRVRRRLLRRTGTPTGSADGTDTADRHAAVDVAALATNAAAALADEPGVRWARGIAATRKGRRTVQITAIVEPTAHLPSVTAAVDRALADLAEIQAPQQPATRVLVHVASSARTPHP